MPYTFLRHWHWQVRSSHSQKISLGCYVLVYFYLFLKKHVLISLRVCVSVCAGVHMVHLEPLPSTHLLLGIQLTSPGSAESAHTHLLSQIMHKKAVSLTSKTIKQIAKELSVSQGKW